jgi:drug/metabolite transporter (DMT)-like permease
MPSLLSLIAIIFSSVAEVIDTVTYKKVSELSIRYRLNKVTLPLIDYIFMLVFFFFPIFFFALGRTTWEQFITIMSSPTFLLCIIAIVAFRIFGQLSWSYAYGNEKISVLAPYSQLSSIVAVILGFIFFRETTDWRTLMFSLIALSVLFFSSFEKANLHFNKYCLILTFSEVCAALRMLIAAYLVQMFLPLSVVFGQIFL